MTQPESRSERVVLANRILMPTCCGRTVECQAGCNRGPMFGEKLSIADQLARLVLSETAATVWAAEGGWSYEGWTLIGVYPSEEAAKAAAGAEASRGYGRVRVTACQLGERVDD